MNLLTTPAGADVLPSSARLQAFLDQSVVTTPFLAIDVDTVVDHYLALQRALPAAVVYYAMKANPLPEIIAALADAGSCFDVASTTEIEGCLAADIPPGRLSFGHTIKKGAAVAAAHAAGIDLFTVDSLGELEKIARHAPGARVTVRLLTNGSGAEWPLSRKFGCDAAMAFDLLVAARALGLHAYGLSFHVGSQQTDPGQWDAPIAASAELYGRLRTEGVHLQALNLGGGFPAHYVSPVPPLSAYAAAIAASLSRHFGRRRPRILVEPGRFLVADAGVIETEVILVSRKSSNDPTRWVYLDCGKFGGLAETMDEAIKYRLEVPGRTGKATPVILAGPTCDSADILYERATCCLPEDLQEGDRIRILSAGAYTHTYASVGFNGFAPLRAACV
jgi:ornithine decarboxylase